MIFPPDGKSKKNIITLYILRKNYGIIYHVVEIIIKKREAVSKSMSGTAPSFSDFI